MHEAKKANSRAGAATYETGCVLKFNFFRDLNLGGVVTKMSSYSEKKQVICLLIFSFIKGAILGCKQHHTNLQIKLFQ